MTNPERFTDELLDREEATRQKDMRRNYYNDDNRITNIMIGREKTIDEIDEQIIMLLQCGQMDQLCRHCGARY